MMVYHTYLMPNNLNLSAKQLATELVKKYSKLVNFLTNFNICYKYEFDY